MDFALSEEQRLYDGTLRGYIAERLPLERLRAIADGGSGFDDALWRGVPSTRRFCAGWGRMAAIPAISSSGPML